MWAGSDKCSYGCQGGMQVPGEQRGYWVWESEKASRGQDIQAAARRMKEWDQEGHPAGERVPLNELARRSRKRFQGGSGRDAPGGCC